MTMVERIAELVAQKGMTLTGVEKALGFGNGAIKRFGVNSPSVDKIVKLSEFLGVTAGYLIDGDLKYENNDALILDERERNLVLHFRALDLDGKARVESKAANEHDRIRLEGDNRISESAV